MWTKAQTAAFQRAVAAADKHQKALDALQEIAKISPVFADRVKDLIDLHEHTRTLAETALAIGLQSLSDQSAGQ